MREERLVRVRRGDTHDDAPATLAHPSPDLQELESQGLEGGRGQLGPGEPLAQMPEEHEREGVEQEPELVGRERVAAGAVGLEVVFEFLDPVLRVPPADVEAVVDLSRGIEGEAGDHEARVEALVQALDLGHDPAGAVPGAGTVAKRGEPALLRVGLGEGVLDLGGELGHPATKALVGDHADDVAHAVLLEQSVEGRDGEPRVGPHQDGGPRVGTPQSGQDAREDPHGTLGCVSVARAQDGGEGVAGDAVEDPQKMEHVLVVEAVEHAQLLGAVGAVVCGIDVEHDEVAWPRM